MTNTRRAFSVATFARHGGRVLLIKHRRLGTWLPVGGEIDPGETPLEAAARELREETGLIGHYPPTPGVDGSPLGFIGYEEHQAGSKGLHMNFAFVADVDTDVVVPNEELSAYAWVDRGLLETVECPKNVRELALLALPAPNASPQELLLIANRWLAAFNARDLDQLLALYDDAAIHTSPKLRVRDPSTNGEIRGKAKLRAWWADSMERLPLLRYEERHLTASDSRVFMEYERINPGEPSMMVAEVLVVERGLIQASYVFHG